MKTDLICEQRYKQIDNQPEHLVEQTADSVSFLAAKNKAIHLYEDWDEQQWQDFFLEQFFRIDDVVVYTLKDVQGIHHP